MEGGVGEASGTRWATVESRPANDGMSNVVAAKLEDAGLLMRPFRARC